MENSQPTDLGFTDWVLLWAIHDSKTADRFWSKVDMVVGGCWEWKAGKLDTGYGLFTVGNSSVNAHRFSWSLSRMEIPKGLHVDHMCKNIVCVNPLHLDAVTPQEHVMRENSVCAQNARKTYCNSGHEFNEENTYVRANGTGRACRVCVKLTMRKKRLVNDQ